MVANEYQTNLQDIQERLIQIREKMQENSLSLNRKKE